MELLIFAAMSPSLPPLFAPSGCGAICPHPANECCQGFGVKTGGHWGRTLLEKDVLKAIGYSNSTEKGEALLISKPLACQNVLG